MIETFFQELRKSIESHSSELESGELLLPEGLAGKRFTKAFSAVVEKAAIDMGLRIDKEVPNSMPQGYKCGKQQIVDYVLYENESSILFVEQESLDRAQLYLFREHDGIKKEDRDNKLRYYYGTIVNRLLDINNIHATVKYFTFLLVLPDQPVNPGPYTLWDTHRIYQLYHPSVKELVCQNPYRFYDHLIKSSARLFLEGNVELPNCDLHTLCFLQDECELVFITLTGKQLILSRGKDGFDRAKEKKIKIVWD